MLSAATAPFLLLIGRYSRQFCYDSFPWGFFLSVVGFRFYFLILQVLIPISKPTGFTGADPYKMSVGF